MSEQPAKRKSGRASKFTPETRKRLIKLVARGLPFTHAASACGISHQSFITYRREHPDFAAQIERAVAVAIEKRLETIQHAADLGDVQSAKWLLEHLHPEFFARNRIELTGVDGKSLTAAVAIYLPQKDNAVPTVEVNPPKQIEK